MPDPEPSWLPPLMTGLLVVPCASIAILFMLQIEVIHDPEPRRLIASAAACAVPAGLFLLRFVEDVWAGPRRSSPPWFWLVWVLVTAGLVALPIATRLGLGTRRVTSGATRQVRDLQFPQTGEIVLAIMLGLLVAILATVVGVIVARWGTIATVLAALLAVGTGYATVPLTFVGMALSYAVVAGPGDDPFADAAQTLSITWFVAVPMTGLIAGWTASRRRRGR